MRVVLLSVLMMVSVVSEAEWTSVSKVSSGNITFFIDLSTIKRTKDGHRRAWLLKNEPDNTKRFPFPTTPKSSKELEEFDCDEGRSRTLSVTLFSAEMGGGRPIETFDGASEWRFILPESVFEPVMKAVCG